MTRTQFIRGTGRWLMLLMILAAGGFMVAYRKISLRDHCASSANCGSCGLRGVCHPREEEKTESDEKE
jgi:hypothetical protein